MKIILAVAKIGKYAVSESGDTLELIERPHGGLSVVLADGQRSGKAAKRISNIVVRKAISLLADGVRDGAAARAAHDYLRTHRGGQVSATLNIVSVDLDTRTLVLSRNSHCPALVHNPRWAGQVSDDGWRYLDEISEAIGVYGRTKPVITEFPLEADTTAIVFTDGIWSAGERFAQRINVFGLAQQMVVEGRCHPQEIADRILAEAVARDRERPVDDMSIVVVGIRADGAGEGIRRMSVSFPV